MTSSSDKSPSFFSSLLQKIGNSLSSVAKAIASFFKGIWSRINKGKSAPKEDVSKGAEQTVQEQPLKKDSLGGAKDSSPSRPALISSSKPAVTHEPQFGSKPYSIQTPQEREAEIQRLIPFLKNEGFSKQIEEIEKSSLSEVDKHSHFFDLYYARNAFQGWYLDLDRALDAQSTHVYLDSDSLKDARSFAAIIEKMKALHTAGHALMSKETSRKAFYEATEEIKSILNKLEEHKKPRLR